jgi:acyl carrier protein
VSRPDEIREGIRAIILSIKPLADGFSMLEDDAPLFNDKSGAVSPISLDSLDALDLAMSIGDEYDLDNDEFERLVESDSGLASLRTINDITALVLSLLEEKGSVPTEANLRGKEVTA